MKFLKRFRAPEITKYDIIISGPKLDGSLRFDKEQITLSFEYVGYRELKIELRREGELLVVQEGIAGTSINKVGQTIEQARQDFDHLLETPLSEDEIRIVIDRMWRDAKLGLRVLTDDSLERKDMGFASISAGLLEHMIDADASMRIASIKISKKTKGGTLPVLLNMVRA